uniref:Uncharacterized protein n=1 Tax=Caenorhabditis japonica TaxID=281687 RepID=A0A8R1DXH4_CAEJA
MNSSSIFFLALLCLAGFVDVTNGQAVAAAAALSPYAKYGLAALGGATVSRAYAPRPVNNYYYNYPSYSPGYYYNYGKK